MAKAIVVGSGISGIRSALDLAETGQQVTIIEKAPFFGGVLTQLDFQFPNDGCGMCRMLPLINRNISSQFCLRKGFFHQNIEILLSAEITKVEGKSGDFKVAVEQRSNWVDSDLCDGCGLCEEKCPIETKDCFNLGLSGGKAIYSAAPHNPGAGYLIDVEACDQCGECVKVCPKQAIKISDQPPEPRELHLEAGAIILAAGTEYFEPSEGKNTYGHNVYPDVLTSRQFERLLSGTGPSQAKLVRLSNGEPATKIAWLQCVGSRNNQTNSDFCSSVCCMHALKEVRLAKQKAGAELEAVIFYMDMRTFGKSFQRYRETTENLDNVRLVRSLVHSVIENKEENLLSLRYTDENSQTVEENFDMVVLSVGQKPSSANADLAEIAGISLNKWGFCQTQPYSNTLTNREGIIIGGSFSGLRDISESVIHAGAAALSASRILSLSDSSSPAAESSALVIGSGLAGMTAALAIADHGFHVDLIEKEKEPGGVLRLPKPGTEGDEIRSLLNDAIEQVKSRPEISLYLESEITQAFGQAGNFSTTIRIAEEQDSLTLRHDVVIFACGGNEAETTSYFRGSHPNVLTQKELEQKLASSDLDPKTVKSIVMIQCADSREEPRNYCSRTCCVNSLKNALYLKELNPDLNIYILYRDLMSYGYNEVFYEKARQAGIIFLSYQTDRKPEAQLKNDALIVETYEPILRRNIKIETDLLVLAVGVESGLSPELARIYGANVDRDGFFQEADSKWRPADSLKEGIFACGLALSPRNIQESIASAEAAAQRALRILKLEKPSSADATSDVKTAICSVCLRCVDDCPYQARQLNEEGQVTVNPLMCQGCGSCTAICPNGAAFLKNCENKELLEELEFA